MKHFSYFDFEILPNYVLVNFLFKNENYSFQFFDNEVLSNHKKRTTIDWFISQTTLIGFNNINYDNLMLALLLKDCLPGELYRTSVSIIENNVSRQEIIQNKLLNGILETFDTIDISPLLVGKASLKMYAARIHAKNIQDLPVDPHSEISLGLSHELRAYCIKDCQDTKDLADNLKDEIELRYHMSEVYNIDLRSKSGPQIANTVLGMQFKNIRIPPIGGPNIPLTMRFQNPGWIHFKTEKYQKLLQDIEADEFHLNDETGHIILGQSVNERIFNIADRSVALGIGGLHSIDGAGYYTNEDSRALIDIDVASMYPSMIINAGWFPSHLGPKFLEVYKDIVKQRLIAKKEGDKSTSESLKLVINASFGQFSSKYSILFNPQLLLNTTLSGQLTLLMLIETLELQDHYVISANTDGIILNPLKTEMSDIEQIVSAFEANTRLQMEYTYYSKYVRRDVNNYFAITDKGKVKGKGIFQVAYDDTAHNPTGNVVPMAVMDWFIKGTTITKNIMDNYNDIRDYLMVRKVNGGAVKDGQYIGKVIRWYYGINEVNAIHYQSNNNKVPKSQGGVLLMDLPDNLPADLDKEIYIKESTKLLQELGLKCKPGVNAYVRNLEDKGLKIVPRSHKGITIMKPGYDFSTEEHLCVQTGYRAKTIAFELHLADPNTQTLTSENWAFYTFEDSLFPGTMKSVSKKLKGQVMYGGPVKLNSALKNTKALLPYSMWNMLYDALTKTQKRKVVGGEEWLI